MYVHFDENHHYPWLSEMRKFIQIIDQETSKISCIAHTNTPINKIWVTCFTRSILRDTLMALPVGNNYTNLSVESDRDVRCQYVCCRRRITKEISPLTSE